MANATIALVKATGAGPTLTAIGNGSQGFSLDDALAGSTQFAEPLVTGTVFSWLATLAYNVTALGTTSQTGVFQVALVTALPTGISIQFKQVGSYTQAASGNRPASSGSDGATAAGFTKLTTSYQSWDATSHNLSGTGVIASYLQLIAAVDSTYVGNGGLAVPLVSLQFKRSES